MKKVTKTLGTSVTKKGQDRCNILSNMIGTETTAY